MSRSSGESTSDQVGFLLRRGRTIVILGTVLFVVSLAFPVVASLVSTESLPSWVGLTDVALAIVFVLAAFWAEAITKGKVGDEVIRRSYGIYRALAVLPLVLLVIFFLVGDGIKWNVLLPGLAWRSWIGLYILPIALSIWGNQSQE